MWDSRNILLQAACYHHNGELDGWRVVIGELPTALVCWQIWDVDEGGAAPADMAMPGTGPAVQSSQRDFLELVRPERMATRNISLTWAG